MFHPDLALFALKFIFSPVPGAALRLPPAIEWQAFRLLAAIHFAHRMSRRTERGAEIGGGGACVCTRLGQPGYR